MGYQYFETTADGYVPVGTDIDAVLRDGDEQILHATWTTFHHIEFTRETLKEIDTDQAKATVAAHMRARLAGLADVTAVQALEANRRLVGLLTGRRWHVMRAAREAGESWAAIGTALGMSKQGALDWYKRKIEDQEKYAGKFHDMDRARAVLPEDTK
ncbi:hypothetical protein AB0M22_45105 [Nocardia sp. NPDC051756]|uniref:hypothetical protein n=1 Tax=Nocardia sp. NPDC051756 TaxID=3154751 RepID=UPI003449DAE4